MKMFLTELKQFRITVSVLLAFICLAQLIFNISKGYILIPPLEFDENTFAWKTFESEIKPVSIDYPDNWATFNTTHGNRGDTQVIAYLSPLGYDYPYVTIAYREMAEATLEEVASWGKSRITGDTYNLFFLEETDIQGRNALKRKYSFGSEQKISCYHVYLLNDRDAYTVEMCVDEMNNSEQLQSVFEQMVQSIVLN